MISDEMIQRGLELGLIELVDSPNDGEPACKIGDYWFYYAGSKGSGMNSAEYIANVPMEEIVREINDALNGLQRDNREEYAYYEAVLLEHGLGTKAGGSLKNLWIRAGMSISISEEEEQVLFSKEAENETLKALFLKIVAEGRSALDGDCYVQFSLIEAFNSSTESMGPTMKSKSSAFAFDHSFRFMDVQKKKRGDNMRVKVIIHDGIPTDVLTDSAEPLEVEILNIDRDYSDYDALEEYEEALLHDPSLRHIDFTTAHSDIPDDN